LEKPKILVQSNLIGETEVDPEKKDEEDDYYGYKKHCKAPGRRKGGNYDEGEDENVAVLAGLNLQTNKLLSCSITSQHIDSFYNFLKKPAFLEENLRVDKSNAITVKFANSDQLLSIDDFSQLILICTFRDQIYALQS
jgi:hypothetical protein